MSHTNEFVTDSISLSAFLLVRGLEIVRTEWFPDRPTWRRFVFGPEAEAAADGYRQNAPIPVKDFLQAFRDVRTYTRARRAVRP